MPYSVEKFVLILQFTQDFFIQQVNRISFIRFIIVHRTIHPGPVTIPDFHLTVTFTAEQTIGIAFFFGIKSFDYCHSFRFGKTSQVEKTAVSTIFIVSIAVTHGYWTGGDNGNTAQPHFSGENITTFLKFYLGQFLHEHLLLINTVIQYEGSSPAKTEAFTGSH